MTKIKNLLKTFSVFEITLWSLSVVGIMVMFCVFGGSILTIIASLIGATALIFVAKGNVIGQVLTVIFSVFYGIISWSFNYYGEVITYLGMTAPIAVLAVITWLRNPYKGNKAEVKVNHIKAKELILMSLSGIGVTFAFYFILKALSTTNLILSTISVFTSFVASYLTMRRSQYYALGYAANDVVLIALWVLATIENIDYLPMCMCFVIFLINDTYGYFNWLKIKKSQSVQ